MADSMPEPGIVPQEAPIQASALCAACFHDLAEHPTYFPPPGQGAPAMPCRVAGCDCSHLSDVCQTCGQLRPCAHWSSDQRPIPL